jgi:hypothetical protein
MSLGAGGLAVVQCEPEAMRARHLTLVSTYADSACHEVQMVYLHGFSYYNWKHTITPHGLRTTVIPAGDSHSRGLEGA